MRMSDLSSDVCSSDLHLPSGKNAVALQQKNTPLAGLPCRIDKSAVGYGEKSVHAHPSTPLALRVSTSRQAMRTATPISTCSVIAERTGSSATALVISRSEEHTSELQSLMRISYAVFCLKKQQKKKYTNNIKR